MKQKLLLVDPHTKDLKRISGILSGSLNIEIVVSQTYEDAKKIIAKDPDFSVILIDIDLPVLQGIELAKYIKRENNVVLPIIFLYSNEKSLTKQHECYSAGAIDVVRKPQTAAEQHVLTQKVQIFMYINAKREMLKEEVEKGRVMSEELSHTQKMLRSIINNVPQYVFWKDTDSKFVGCNQQFAAKIGIDNPKDIAGKTEDEVCQSKENANRFKETDKKVLQTNTPIYQKVEHYLNEDGSKTWYNVNRVPLNDKKGNVVGILGTMEDISGIIDLQKKISENNAKHKSLIESTNTAYMILDINGSVIEANDIFLQMMECKDTDLKGKSPRSHVVANDIKLFDEAFAELIKGNQVNDLEIGFKTCTEDKVVYTSISANLIENGNTKIFCLVRDISHKKKKEDTERIVERRRKDTIKQNILSIRDQLRGSSLFETDSENEEI